MQNQSELSSLWGKSQASAKTFSYKLILFWFVWAWLIPLLFLGGYAFAYTYSRDSSGTFIKWSGSPKYFLAGNQNNNSGVSPETLREAMVKGLQRWEEASSGAIEFEYWQGTDDNDFEASGNYNGLNSVYFATHSSENLDAGLIALTQTWYNTGSGQILEADIVLNDRYYWFTNNPTDTVGSGNGSPSGRVYIQNVVTHELGHAFGLGHSPHLQASMQFMEGPDQAHLSCDDWLAIRTYYDADQNHRTGSLVGRVQTPHGANLFGAHAVAISIDRGTVLAGNVSDQNGQFRIDGLEAGPYVLMIEPVYAGASALTDYFEGMDTRICSGWHFGRTFVTQSDAFRMKTFTVKAGGQTQAGDVAVKCSASSGAALGAPRGGSSLANAASISKQGNDFSVVDTVGSTFQYYRLEDVSGSLRLSANAFSLYSPIGVELRLLDLTGAIIASAQTQHPTYTSESAYQNYDASLSVQGLSSGDYYLRVETYALSSIYYPVSSSNMDANSFFVLTGSHTPQTPDFADVLPWHVSCRSSEVFAPYQSPGGKPLRYVVDEDGAGFCGTVEKAAPPSAGSPNQMGSRLPLPSVIAWFFPFIWMLMIMTVWKSRSFLRILWARLLPDSAPVRFKLRGNFSHEAHPR